MSAPGRVKLDQRPVLVRRRVEVQRVEEGRVEHGHRVLRAEDLPVDLDGRDVAAVDGGARPPEEQQQHDGPGVAPRRHFLEVRGFVLYRLDFLFSGAHFLHELRCQT